MYTHSFWYHRANFIRVETVPLQLFDADHLFPILFSFRFRFWVALRVLPPDDDAVITPGNYLTRVVRVLEISE